jgi:hypothetical protein
VSHAPDQSHAATLRPLSEVVAERRIKPRDCRSCRNYEPDRGGLGFGWCSAHEQHVKLFHPSGEWFSQCLFKGLRRFKPQELELASGPPNRSEGGP